MVASAVRVASSNDTSGLVADDIAQYAYKSWDELFSMSRAEVEEFQLRSARRRFEELTPRVRALKDQADHNGVSRIDKLGDIVPLLFGHTVYKSYPIALLETNRFGMLTEWLARSTSIDLSSVDVGSCESIDDWMSAVEAQTPLQIFHTSGTTGKLSFIPRTTLERDIVMRNYLWSFSRGFGNEPSVEAGGAHGVRMPVIYPSVRHGRYTAQRILDYLAHTVAPSPDQCYTLNNGTLSADLVSLSGRIRMAQAKGELAKMKLSDSQRVALKRYLEELARRPEETAAFFGRMIEQLRGKQVLMFSQSSFLSQASATGLARGVRNVFSADSLACTGGGGKDVVLPQGWKEDAMAFTGIPYLRMYYTMTEMLGLFPGCPSGHYHATPYIIPFILDPETGEELPRHGVQTGRLGLLDLLAQTYWGGIVTGDMVTIEWDSACPCGRKGAFFQDNVGRYATHVTGDDKVTCAATVDNTDAALQKLLAVKGGYT